MTDTMTSAGPLEFLQDSPAEFDKLVHGPESLPSGDALRVVHKGRCTRERRGIAVLAFNVQLPDGTLRVAQYVTTARQLMALGTLLQAAETRAEHVAGMSG